MVLRNEQSPLKGVIKTSLFGYVSDLEMIVHFYGEKSSQSLPGRSVGVANLSVQETRRLCRKNEQLDILRRYAEQEASGFIIYPENGVKSHYNR